METWVGVIYYEKCNSDVLIDCIRHCVLGESGLILENKSMHAL